MIKFGLREAHGSLCDDASRMNTDVLQHTESLLLLFTKLNLSINNKLTNELHAAESFLRS